MVSQKFLFANFLSDPKIYALNQGFWTAQLRSRLPHEAFEKEHLYQMHFANGKKIYDGNPIYSALLKNQKSLRIIQKQPKSEQPEIKAWIHSTESDGIEIQELVISTELTAITKQVVIALITEWLNTKTEVFDTERYITERLESLRTTSVTPSSSGFRTVKSISDSDKRSDIHREYLERQKKRAVKTYVKTQEKQKKLKLVKK